MFRVSGTVRKGSKTAIYRHHFLMQDSLSSDRDTVTFFTPPMNSRSIILELPCFSDRLFVHVFDNYCELLMKAICNISPRPVDIYNMFRCEYVRMSLAPLMTEFEWR